MRKTALVLLLVAVGLGVASIPSYSLAHEQLVIHHQRMNYVQPHNIRILGSTEVSDTSNDYRASYDSATVMETYAIDCGTALHPNNPPALSLAGTSQPAPFTQQLEYLASSRATAMSMARTMAANGTEPEAVPNPADWTTSCGDDVTAKRFAAFLASPLGWVTAAVIALVAVGLFVGGGGGWSGSASPRLWGGGFRISLWR